MVWKIDDLEPPVCVSVVQSCGKNWCLVTRRCFAWGGRLQGVGKYWLCVHDPEGICRDYLTKGLIDGR